MSTFGEVQFDIALPQVFIDGRPDTGAIAAFAANAEQLGFGGLWTQDQVIGQANQLTRFVENEDPSISISISYIYAINN